MAVQMFEDNQLRFLGLDACPSRNMELEHSKETRIWKPDNTNTVKEHRESTAPSADVRSDLGLMQALQRRGMALDIARLCSFEVHAKLQRFYMSAAAASS